MPRPRQISDEQILEQMRNSVLEHGPQVSLDQVAAKLDVTAPALLKRFGSRQELMLAALKPPAEPSWLALTDKGPDGRPLAEQLEEIFTAIQDFFEEITPLMSALRESGIPHDRIFPRSGGKPPMHKSAESLVGWLKAAREKGLVSTQTLEVAANAMLGSISTRCFAAHLTKVSYSPQSQKSYVREMAQFFTQALCPAASAPRSTRRARP